MIDLMMKNVKGDAMFAYGDSMYIYNLMFYICDDTAEFASYWAQKRSSVETRAEEYYQMYEKLIKWGFITILLLQTNGYEKRTRGAP